MAKLAPVMAKKATAKAKPVSVPEHQYASVSVRKISNGYVISRSKDGPGGYNSTEEFSAQKPKIDIPVSASSTKARK